jgi:outer membrane protein assembly factor BamB
VIVVGDDGIVRARDSLTQVSTQMWAHDLGATIKASPVVDGGVVYVATTAGVVHALDQSTGDTIWTYPAGDAERLGRITADLALGDGVLYVGAEDGMLHLIGTDGSLVCETDQQAPITVNPIVVDGLAYVSAGNLITILPSGECQVPVTQTVQFLSETVVDVAPAVVGDLMYVPNAQFLNAVDLSMVGERVSDPAEVHHWSEGKVGVDSKIASPPVVTDDAVYFGTENGTAYAVDSDTGDLLWQWRTENYVRASPVVLDGVAYIASGDGNVYAVGPAG